MASKHKWDTPLDKGHKFSTCLNCGCVRESHFPAMYYFVDYCKYQFTSSPNCDMVKDKTISPIQERFKKT